VRILVTGGRGFIGTAVTADLVAAGHDVVVLDAASPRDVRPGFLAGDVRDGAAVATAVAGADAVVHLAAKVGLGVGFDDVEDYVSANDLGTAVVLRAAAAAGVGRFVLASSMVVYGEGAYDCPEHGRVRPGPRRVADLEAGRFEPPCPTCGRPLEPGLVEEDAPLEPRNTYAATKVHGEHLAAVWARETGGRAAGLRFHNVYGPGLPVDTPYAGVMALFRSELLAGRPPRVFEDGAQRRDFVEVGDVAAAVTAAAERLPVADGGFRAWNVGSGRVRTIGDAARLLSEVVGGPAPVVTGRFRRGDVRHVTASSERAAAELGWRARTSLEDGLRTLVEGAR